MALRQSIQAMASGLQEKLVGHRRHLHQHPELSFKEYQTSAYLQEQLRAAGIPFKQGYAGTGIVGLIEGRNPSKRTILLRADMDALPIEEKNEVPYCSQNRGVMHACGHDVHSTVVLGAAIILNQLKSEFEGRVKIMFQPGEEVLPGGASLMIKEKVLQDPKVEKALALHVFPEMEAGEVGFREGKYMASTDELYVRILGKGGHAAMPERYTNPLIAASAFLLEVDRHYAQAMKQEIPAVVAFGKIEGQGATNVIPDRVDIAGTLRTLDEGRRAAIKAELGALLEKTCQAYSCGFEWRVEHGYPCLINDPAFTAQCSRAAKAYLGSAKVHELPLRMTAEDFAYISQEVPSCFFRLGTGNSGRGIRSGVHTATFDIDESALQTGAGLLAWLAIQELHS